MRKSRLAVSGIVLFSVQLALGAEAAAPIVWAMNATVIEACSCPMFCQCYFNDNPAAHHDHASKASKHFCKANLAFRVNKGQYGATKLDGAKFWVAADLGDRFSDGELGWAIVTFDPAVTKEQRDGIAKIVVGNLFPFKWQSLTVAADQPIEWTPGKDRAIARMDGGKAGEVVLRRFQGYTDDPIVIKNLRYWGAPRNDGFILMPNEVEAYRVGEKAFEFHGTNGFMITFDIKSSDFAAPGSPAGR